VTRVRAWIDVPGPISEAESLWYDLDRWPSFVDGFAAVARRDEAWPRSGSTLVWDSRPDGRGRVVERVTRWEPREGQTAEVEDEKLRGTQVMAFGPSGAGTRLELSLAYELKSANPVMRIVDAVFIRRSMRDSLRRTVVRFARELEGDRALGVR
jgi:polyketide cyclase/dehydrase/lipid transport protein